jgi:hypothetical protein
MARSESGDARPLNLRADVSDKVSSDGVMESSLFFYGHPRGEDSFIYVFVRASPD